MHRSFLCLSRWNISDAALGSWWDLQFPVPDAPQHLGRPFIQWSDAVPSFPMDFGWLWIRRTGPFAPCYIQGFLSSHGCPESRKAWAVQEKVFCTSREVHVCVRACACVRAHVCACVVQVSACVRVCVCVRVCTNIHVHVWILLQLLLFIASLSPLDFVFPVCVLKSPCFHYFLCHCVIHVTQ